MRMNYKIYPTDYYDELIRDGHRKKAMAFHNYWHDIQNWNPTSTKQKHPYTYRFYAKAWGVSKDTASLWINGKKEDKEGSGFHYEIALFNAHWQIKNAQHYSYVEKQDRQKVDKQLDKKKPCQALDCGNDKKGIRHPIRQEVDEVFNSIEEEGDFTFFKELELIFSTYANYSNRLGEEAYRIEAYRQIRSLVELEDLLKSINKYFGDETIQNFYSLPKFLKNKIFLVYIDRRIKVRSGDSDWLFGRYVASSKTIMYDDGRRQRVADDVFVSWLSRGDIVYLGRGE